MLRDDAGWFTATTDAQRGMRERYALTAMGDAVRGIITADAGIAAAIDLYGERMASRPAQQAIAPRSLARAGVEARRTRDDAALSFIVALIAWVQT